MIVIMAKPGAWQIDSVESRAKKNFHLTASLVTRIMCDKVQIPPCAVSAPTQEDHERRGVKIEVTIIQL